MKTRKSDKQTPQKRPRDPDLIGAEAAMHRAAARARRRAARHTGYIVVYENGEIIRVKVDDETST